MACKIPHRLVVEQVDSTELFLGTVAQGGHEVAFVRSKALRRATHDVDIPLRDETLADKESGNVDVGFAYLH